MWKIWVATIAILFVWAVFVLWNDPHHHKRFFGREQTWTDR